MYQKSFRSPYMKGAYNKLLGGAKNVSQILDDPFGQALIFAGSTAIGHPEVGGYIVGSSRLAGKLGLHKALQKQHHMH